MDYVCIQSRLSSASYEASLLPNLAAPLSAFTDSKDTLIQDDLKCDATHDGPDSKYCFADISDNILCGIRSASNMNVPQIFIFPCTAQLRLQQLIQAAMWWGKPKLD